MAVVRKRRAALLSCAALLGVLCFVFSACGRPVLNADISEDLGDTSIALSVDGEDGQVLVEIYAEVLRRSGYDVSIRNEKAPGRADPMKELDSGETNAILIRSGALLSALDPKATQTSADDVMSALNKAVPSGVAVLKPTKADGKDILVTTAALAEKYKFRSTADMAKACRNLIFGMTAEFAAAPYGLPRIEKKDRCSFKGVRKFSGGQEAALVRALQKEEIQLASLPSSDPAIKDNGFVVVGDSNNSLVSQNFVLVIAKDRVGRKAQSLWNEVGAKLDGNSLTFLKREMVGNTKKTPAQAAGKWLDENGFKVQ